MKKLLLFTALFISLSTFAQKKDSVVVSKDTTIQILLSINQYRALLSTMDRYIDSKAVTKDWFDFLQKIATIYQPADKPKK